MWLPLKHTTDPTSIEDLGTVDGELYHDFKGACIALGLCEDDSQWMEAMAEAVRISHPSVNENCSYNPEDSGAIFDQYSSRRKENFIQCRARGLNLTDN